MTKHTAYIALGSNLGERVKNIREALRLLEEHPLIKVMCLSQFYETEPLTLNGQKQNWYVNCVLKIRTSLNCVRLFQVLQNIEKLLGRQHSHRWAPRTMDLDLLFFDDEILRTKSLILPHPRLHQRRFVLEPLCEIAPNLVHPIKGVPVQVLLKKLDDNKKVVPLYKFYLSHSSEGVLKTPVHERF